ncbi:MAG: 50S ribosomal protein L11 methyltransferase, partial [Acidimicrobiaceae bacterium]
DRVVDLGTGSGILAIAAARLGADVIGIDLDPAAAPAVRANAIANGVRERVEVRIGDISDIGNDESFDVALLNVTIDIHESVAPAVERLDVPLLIVAGILDGEQAERAARLHGRVPTDRLGEDGWVALVFDRGRNSAPI